MITSIRIVSAAIDKANFTRRRAIANTIPKTIAPMITSANGGRVAKNSKKVRNEIMFYQRMLLIEL